MSALQSERPQPAIAAACIPPVHRHTCTARTAICGAGCSRRASARTGLSDSPAVRVFSIVARSSSSCRRVGESSFSPPGFRAWRVNRTGTIFVREGRRRSLGAICPWRRERQRRTSPRVFVVQASQRRPERNGRRDSEASKERQRRDERPARRTTPRDGFRATSESAATRNGVCSAAIDREQGTASDATACGLI